MSNLFFLMNKSKFKSGSKKGYKYVFIFKTNFLIKKGVFLSNIFLLACIIPPTILESVSMAFSNMNALDTK